MLIAFARPIAAGLLLLLSAASLSAQPAGYEPRRAHTFSGNPARPLTGPSTAGAAAVVLRFLSDRGVIVAAASLVPSGDPVTAANGITTIRFDQTIGGLLAYGVYARVALTARGEIVQLIENLVPGSPQISVASRANESAALAAALRHLYPQQNIPTANPRRNGNTTVFDRTPFFHEGPSVTRVAIAEEDGTISSGHLVETWSEQGNRLHHTLIGAAGNVLRVEERTSSDAYKVFLEDPTSTPTQTVVPGPGTGNAQSPAGWLFGSAQTSLNIAGNNVNAYLDVNANNKPDAGGLAVTTGDFLTDANLTVTPATATNREVAVQNLFFLNNRLHDVLLQYGFTEGAGNFQQTNFTPDGRGNDSVLAEAQDGSGTDNANFATPPDGRAPRMQMFLWTGAGATLQVVINSPVSATYPAGGAAFGPAPSATGLTGDVAIVDDGTAPNAQDACEPIQPIAGKIALLDRGTCDFTVKVFNAQAAGAIGVIVANNQGGNSIIGMGGTNHRIKIPAVLISQNNGAALKALVDPNATIRQNPTPPIQVDSSLDSDVVYHEYGHGLTWRMIGGMSGALAGALGEGASDTVAMLLNGDDRIGEYSASDPLGIRRAPYAGYPNTYSDVDGESVHNDGEIYAAAMWRLIELFGADRDRLAGIFVDGMNFTPETPAYEDMRDGMLQSIANSGGQFEAEDTCRVWQAFAQFGIGDGAQGIVKGKSVTISESFTVPASACVP